MAASRRTPDSEIQRTDRFRAMGSDVTIVAIGTPAMMVHARDRIIGLEHVWSRFLPDSDISMLNRSRGWVEVSGDTITLVERAERAWALTGGAYDPTILPSLVSSGYEDSRSESTGRTDFPTDPERHPSPGMSRIDVDAARLKVRIPGGIGFDPGGIGKGLAADIVAGDLLSSGAAAAIVSIGGDVRVAGDTPPDWVVEVEDPFDQEQNIARLRILDGGVCTSSVRAKSWIHEGTSMHHLIDPFTGEPSDSRVVSATVVAGEAWLAEVLCKPAVIAEPVDALAWLTAIGAEGLLVDADGVVWRTPGVARFAA